MLSLTFILLLTTLAVAIPAPLTPVTPPQQPALSKRSFVVPRRLNPARTRQLNGRDAMRKAYAKYGWGFIDIQKSGIRKGKTNGIDASIKADNGTRNGTGTVGANPQDNASLFLSPVTIGGQKFNLDLDTGSADLWVFSTALSTASIGQHAAFDPSQSSTFAPLQNAKFSISYGDGSGASGVVGTDVVEIGGTVVEKQTVELATKVSKSFVQDLNTDGLMGLAFSKINTVNDGTRKTPQKTFFENVMPGLDLPLFTADLDPDGTGVYEFGKIDSTKFKGDLAWIPINSTAGFWQFDSEKFAVGDQVVDNPGAGKAIADTGTSLLLVDQNLAEAYYSAVPSAAVDPTLGGFVYPCDTKLPDLSVAIGTNYMAKIPGNMITFAPADDTNTTCFGGVQGNGGAGLQIFGDTLFKAQYVVFNGGNETLGMASKT